MTDTVKLLDFHLNEEEQDLEELEEFEIGHDDQEESFEVISTDQRSVQKRDDLDTFSVGDRANLIHVSFEAAYSGIKSYYYTSLLLSG
jgi:hypothetical protein